MRKPDFCICENKDADQLRGNRILWLYRLVCVGPGRKPERLFSHDAAQFFYSTLRLHAYEIMIFMSVKTKKI